MKKRDAKDFVIQRKNIEGRLSAPLNLRIWKKIGICGITMGLTLSLTACGIKTTDIFISNEEIGNYETGFRLNSFYFHEDVKRATKEYSLIKLDNKIYVAYTFSSVDLETGNLVFRYYDIEDKKFLGMSIVKSEIDDLDRINNTSFDYFYCNGSYAMGDILPFGAVINLSEVVTSIYPREQDLAFWSSNTEEVQKRFNDLLLEDISFITVRKFNTDKDAAEQNTLKYNCCIPAQVFICTKNDGQTDTIIGYRGSENESDIGYNYVYDVITGTITYIGKNSEDVYVEVTVTKAPSGLTIKQVADKYDIEIVYSSGNVESSIVSNDQSIEPENTNAMPQSELTDTENTDTTQSDIDNSVTETPEEKYYKNGEIMILDVKALKETGAVEYCEDDDIEYVILLEGEKYGPYGLEKNYIDLINGTLAYETSDPTTIYYENDSIRIYITTIPQAKSLYTPSSLLKEIGEVDVVQDEYSLTDLIILYDRLNPRKEVYVSKDKIKMFDTSSINGTSGWILVEETMHINGSSPYYYDPSNREFKLHLIEDSIYYVEPHYSASRRIEESAFISLEDYLNKIERTDLLKDEYSQGEILTLKNLLEKQDFEHHKSMQ